MTHAEFVHLHNHTEYSLLDGACRILDDRGKPGELFHLVGGQHKLPALALTDHGNMYGAIEFYTACLDSGIKPIIGCEVYVAPGSRFDKTYEKGREVYYHLTLLAKDHEGYQNLMRMVSAGFLEGFYYKPRVDRELIEKYHKGVIALSGCLQGQVANNLLKGNMDEAESLASQYRDIFGADNYYIEIMDNGIPEQRQVLQPLLDLSKKLGIPSVATNDCHYLRKEDAYDHDVLLCIGTGKTIDDPNRLKFSTNEFYYRSPQEMAKVFQYTPESIKNTLAVAEKVALELNFDQLLLPHYPVPEGETAETYLEKLCREGMKRRYSELQEKHEARLKHELGIINRMGFAAYFLIVWDFIHYAKNNGVSVGPGRGSGAGSIVAYSLGITDICPLHYGLLFERFLNPDRRSMPDLDIDFADTGREKIIEYVRNKYGHANCAQIITYGSMQARLVIKDVARAMGFLPTESDRIAKMVPMGSNIYGALQSVPELKALTKDDRIAKLLHTSMKLEGLKRHTGVHAAGMLIAKEEITNYSPLAKGSRDVVTTQYDGNALPKLGLLKVDFLGLRTLSVIDEAVDLIHKTADPEFDLDKVSLEDPKTYQLLQDARTLGVFQLESRGMRDLLRKLKPTTIEDVIALISLYRPGPMGSGMVDDFVARKHGRVKVKYDHEVLEPILRDTYGVILYQEQVMRIAQDLAGFTAGQADGLRKAMGKKIPEEIEKQRGNFMDGAHKKGIEKKIAEKVFQQIVHFGGYGFNKSHAGAYGVLSYKTAYLKANYPIQYIIAMLNSEIGHVAIGKDDEENKIVNYMEDAESIDIQILPPDVQKSHSRFSIEDGKIRFGLLAIKNVGEGATESIAATRQQKGEFETWDDFIGRIDLQASNRRVLESLIKAGACDCFGESHTQVRSELMAGLDQTLDRVATRKEEQSSGQGFLFDAVELAAQMSAQIKVDPWSEHTALSFEKEVLGFYLSGHPLAQHRHDLMVYSQYRLDRLPQPASDPKKAPIVRVAGMIASIKRLITKEKKEQYARFKLEDLTGGIEVVVFPKSYKSGLDRYLTPNNVVVVRGRLSGREMETEMLAEEILTFDEARQRFPAFVGTVHLRMSSAGLEDEMLDRVKKVIHAHPGNSTVILEVSNPGHDDYMVETDFKVKTSDRFLRDLEKILGADAIELRKQPF